MRRRDFVMLAGGAAAWPLAGWAQAPGKKARIGILTTFGPSNPFVGLLRDSLRAQGYVDGQNAQVEIRNADGKQELLPNLAAELVRLKVDLIIASPTPAVQAAKQATSRIPIVMFAGDPVGTGLIASLARPGGNITGLSLTTAEVGAKSLELVRELIPSASRVAVLANADDPFTKSLLEQIQAAARSMAMETPVFMVRRADEFKSAFAAMEKQRVSAVIIQPSLPRKAAIDLALQYRLPTLSPTGGFPTEGGLMSYAANPEDSFRVLMGYVDKILKGARPADLPVQQPTKFDLIVNLKTGRAIGLTIPKSILARADRVIE